MEFNIAKNKIKDNIEVAMRTAGYHKLAKNGLKSELSFVKPLSLAGFPRFHIYLKQSKTDYVFSSHLDQKKPVHKNTKAHQADYNSDIVNQEAERIIKKITV